MAPVIVLITFYSRCGTTEMLASAAAVGAVQARANIRLRRVPDLDAQRALEESSSCKEDLLRMHKEYVAPTETDVLGADAIVLVPQQGAETSSAEWTSYFSVLEKLASEGKLAGKVGAIVDTGSASTLGSFSSALRRLPLTIATPDDSLSAAAMDRAELAREVGRRVVGAAARRADT